MLRAIESSFEDPVPPKIAGVDSSRSGGRANLYHADAAQCYVHWPSPTVIVADGPYGVAGYPGDLSSWRDLPAWYEPHIEAWSERALPCTTLWFWNTEVGWAAVHPVLDRHGWEYVRCSTWDKGVGHIAGNCNSATMRSFPCVTEVCVQYVRRVRVSVASPRTPLELKVGELHCRSAAACCRASGQPISARFPRRPLLFRRMFPRRGAYYALSPDTHHPP